MKVLTTYVSYEEANDRQLDLLASGIDARVEYVPSGGISALGGSLGTYQLWVDGEKISDAALLIAPALDPSATSIAACPRCGSSDVTEQVTNPLTDVLMLMVPSILEFAISRISGSRFHCSACRHNYRKQLTRL
jgi:hypothetical protein